LVKVAGHVGAEDFEFESEEDEGGGEEVDAGDDVADGEGGEGGDEGDCAEDGYEDGGHEAEDCGKERERVGFLDFLDLDVHVEDILITG
jgi:hypothetical protein